ncbi:MAG: GntR family transcriptional regulator [Hyphomicrobiales bacterium]|nr:MAG: GntR family transcriptional regulator [Hyphomicrobiales bacterium]
MSASSEPRREDVYKRLRDEILSCTLTPGQPLYEREIAERFSLSKSPVRDALVRLQAERLVIVLPRVGYRVAPVSLSDAEDLFDYRALMEEAAARRAAEAASDADLEALDRFRTAKGWEKKGGFVAYNRSFHLALAALCPNKRIALAASDLIEHFDRLVVMSVSVMEKPRDSQALVEEHGAIIDAMQGRDARAVGKLLSRHVDRARRRVIGALSQTPIIP